MTSGRAVPTRRATRRPPGGPRTVGIMRGFSTNAIHAGQEPDPTTGAVITPLHLSSTFAQDGVGGTRAGGYEYARSANPTRTALQECLAALEGGRHARAFGSGMGAERRAAARCCCAPATTSSSRTTPTAARSGWSTRSSRRGASSTPRSTSADIDALRAAVRPTTRVVWCETPTNPLLGIADIAAVADVTPGGGRPARRRQHLRLALPAAAARARRGRRAALHHQVPRRALRRRRRRARDRRRRARRAARRSPRTPSARCPARSTTGSPCAGSRPSPCAWSGTATTPSASPTCSPHHPAVARVLYPGLPEHPGHEVAAKQMRRFGGMVSFLPAGGREAALRVCAATELFILAESLGGVESLIEHPGQMTHMSVAGLGAGGARLAGAPVGGHRGRRRPDRGPAHRAGPRRRLTPVSRPAAAAGSAGTRARAAAVQDPRVRLVAGERVVSTGFGAGAGFGTTMSPGAMQPPTSS